MCLERTDWQSSVPVYLAAQITAAASPATAAVVTVAVTVVAGWVVTLGWVLARPRVVGQAGAWASTIPSILAYNHHHHHLQQGKN